MSCTSTCPITHFIPKNVVTLVTFSFFVNRNAKYLAYNWNGLGVGTRYFFLYQSSKPSKESLSFVVFLDYIILWWRHEIYDVMSFGQIQPSPPKNNVPVRLWTPETTLVQISDFIASCCNFVARITLPENLPIFSSIIPRYLIFCFYSWIINELENNQMYCMKNVCHMIDLPLGSWKERYTVIKIIWSTVLGTMIWSLHWTMTLSPFRS
jgi:hypothetical protein